MRSVVYAAKFTVRLTRLLPLTLPSVTQAEPFQPCTVNAVMPYRREGHRVGRLDRVGVVVLDRIDDDVIDRLAAVEVDLDPVGPRVGGGVVPAAADAPVGAGAHVVDDRGHRESRCCRCSRRWRHRRCWPARR